MLPAINFHLTLNQLAQKIKLVSVMVFLNLRLTEIHSLGAASAQEDQHNDCR